MTRAINPKPKHGLTTGEITHAVHKLFSNEWLILEELFIPGFDRFVDVWAICIGASSAKVPIRSAPWTSHKFGFEWLKIHAIEVKATRADFLSELKNPSKRMPAQLFSNYFSFAAPRGIIELEEVPEEIGYIEIQGTKPKIIRKPDCTRSEPPGWEFIAAIGRALL